MKRKTVYKTPLTEKVCIRLNNSVTIDPGQEWTETDQKSYQAGQLGNDAKGHNFDNDDFNFEKGGVGEWSSDWSSECKTAEE